MSCPDPVLFNMSVSHQEENIISRIEKAFLMTCRILNSGGSHWQPSGSLGGLGAGKTKSIYQIASIDPRSQCEEPGVGSNSLEKSFELLMD